MSTKNETSNQAQSDQAQTSAPTKTSKTTEAPASKYSKEELLAIFDEILFSGEYIEQVTIKGKLKVSFRTRTVEDTTEISKVIDASSSNLISTVQEKRAVLNMVYSLASYNGKDLTQSTIEDRQKFVNKLPAVVVSAVSEALRNFDLKTEAAFAEGELNF